MCSPRRCCSCLFTLENEGDSLPPPSGRKNTVTAHTTDTKADTHLLASSWYDTTQSNYRSTSNNTAAARTTGNQKTKKNNNGGQPSNNKTNQTNELKTEEIIFQRKTKPHDYAVVVKATYSGFVFAVKTFIPTDKVTENRRKNITILNRERLILKALGNKSQHIIYIYNNEETNSTHNPRIVMDLHPHSLYDLIKHQKQTVSSLFFSQTYMALTFLHEKNILHNDIKPRNILISSNGDAVITDFGCAKNASDMRDSSLEGTPGYWSPEMISRDRIPTTSSDCWSLYATWFFALCGLELIDAHMYTLLHSRFKFHSDAIKETYEKYIEAQNIMIVKKVGDHAGCFTSFFLQAFKVDPKERPKLMPALNTVQDIICKNYQLRKSISH